MDTTPSPTRSTKPKPTVVVIGAGFGGLEAVKALKNANVDITVIDRKNHHCFQPLLYQVATAALSPADVAWPIRSIFRRQRRVRVMLAEVSGIDTGQKTVRTSAGVVDYDHLIIATGATHSYFGHDAWATHAPGLKSIDDARLIRRKVLLAFEQAELATDPAEAARLLTFVVIGGGPTGAELAGAIAEVARHTLARDFRRINPAAARVVLVEAGPRILPTLPTNLSDYAQAALSKIGVDVLTNARVTQCAADAVHIGEITIPAATTIWAAGVKASPAASWLNVSGDRQGRVPVDPFLQVSGLPDVYAIGDTAAALSDERPVPGVAPAAKQMGRHAASVITAKIAGRPMTPFRYRDYGDFATLGRSEAVARFGSWHIRGFLAWMLWSVAHVYYLIGNRNRAAVGLTWLWSYSTFQRGARLIS